MLRARWWWGAVAGSVASVASFATFQVYNQNSASIAAVATVPVVLAAIRIAACRPDSRTLLVLAAVATAGLVGVYSELASVVGLPAVLLAVVGVPGRWWQRLRRAALMGVLALVLAPLAFINALRLWSSLSSVVSAWERRAFTQDPSLTVARAVGTSSINELRGTSAVTVLVLAVLVVELGVALLRPVLRTFTVGLVVSVVAAVTAQARRGDNYSIERIVMVGQPLVVLAAALGLMALGDTIVRPSATQLAGARRGRASSPRRC